MFLRLLKSAIKKLVRVGVNSASGEPVPALSKDHPFSLLPLAPNDVKLVVDVGAFTGHYSYIALNRYPRANVIAYEPTSCSANTYEANHLPGGRAKLYRAAVSNHSGKAKIHITSTGAANSLDIQSVEHKRQNPHVVEEGFELVPIVTLDETLPSSQIIDIMKIDVEGFELNVLEGGKSSLSRTKFLIIEISLARDHSIEDQAVFKIFALLNELGFSLYTLIDLYPFGQPEPHLGIAQFDAVFRNNAYPLSSKTTLSSGDI